MTEAEARPPEHPTPNDLRDAIEKGLGRAIIWARAGLFGDFELLREFCLSPKVYDRQCEGSRGPWLWDLLIAADSLGAMRQPILTALQDIRHADDPQVLCDFALRYAQAGDESFRDVLRDIVFFKPLEDYESIGEEELMLLDGADGFLAAASARGMMLDGRRWSWSDERLMGDAARLFGAVEIQKLLDQRVGASENLAGFRDFLADSMRATPGRLVSGHRDVIQRTTPDDIIAGEFAGRYGRLRSWGRSASAPGLEIIYEAIVTAQEWQKSRDLLAVFSARPLPRVGREVLELLSHPIAEVRRRTYDAAGNTSHPDLREFAVRELERRARDENFLGLFAHNYYAGDGAAILAALGLPGDADARHSVAWQFNEIAEANPTPDAVGLAMWAYRHTPCSLCRLTAAEALVEANSAPAWLIDEYREDVQARDHSLDR